MNYKALDEALEYLEEAATYQIIRRDGKNYVIHTTAEIDKIAKQAASILKEYVKKLYALPEWKEIKKNVEEEVTKHCTGFNKMPEIVYDSEMYGNDQFYYIIQTGDWLSQYNFYAEYTPGKHVCQVMDSIYKKLSTDPRVKKLPRFDQCYNGDDFANWAIYLKLNPDDIVEKEEQRKK